MYNADFFHAVILRKRRHTDEHQERNRRTAVSFGFVTSSAECKSVIATRKIIYIYIRPTAS